MTLHQSVLLPEAIEGLSIQSSGIYIDGTFGRGGHSRAILERLGQDGRLIAIDKDQAAVAFAAQEFKADPRFIIHQGSFTKLSEITKEYGCYGQVQGILLDLGLSSPQIDEADRGFSFMQPGPLDMRMDQSRPETAADFVNTASAELMSKVFFDYGEERFARRIAAAIVKAREIAAIERTEVLAEIVKAANPKWERHKHPATRVFQAIRIYVNQELDDLQSLLEQSIAVLARGGRLAVISFHSLEDRIVKQFMRDKERGLDLPFHIPIPELEASRVLKRVGKAIKPSEVEVQQNIRARSAVLRIGEKIA